MSNTTEDVDFAQGGDTGENDDLSIQPLGYAGSSEANSVLVVNRVLANLRRRTERLRDEVQDLKFRADYNNGLLLWTTGTVRLVSDSGSYRLVLTSNLSLLPALSPGYQSGGRAKGAVLFIGNNNYAGSLGVNDLSLIASSDYTGQRGYADGTSMADAGVLSIGGNNITVELVGENRAGGFGSIRATVTGSPRRHIRITYGTQAPGITIAQLVNAINSDATLFGTEGSFGLRHLIRASTTSPGTSTTIPDFGRTKLQGGYDAEAHQVTAAQAAAFFSASSENLLADGDGLAIGFPAGLVERGTEAFGGGVWSYLGGRRQALIDAPTDRLGGSTPNVGDSSIYGNLFNTARQPELVPNALPLGRVLGNEFHFIDGTVLVADGPAISIGECYVTVRRVADLTATLAASSGAALVGYGGSPNYHSDASASTNPALAAGTVEATIDQLVTDLANDAPSQSAARRIGVEPVTGTATAENGNAVVTPQGSWRQALQALVGNDTYPTGVSRRVHENGHTMKGGSPLRKAFALAGMPAAGAEFIRAELHPSGDLMATPSLGVSETGVAVLKPIRWTNGSIADDQLLADETIQQNVAMANHWVRMTAPTLSRFNYIKAKLPVPRSTDGSLQLGPVVLAKLTGTAGAADAPEGFYYVTGFDGTTRGIALRKLDLTAPNFTGMSGTGTINFYSGVILGNDANNAMLKAHLWNYNRNPIVIGLGDKSQPVMEFVYNDGSDPNAKAAKFFGNYAQWPSLRRTAGGASTRDTENILQANDKQLLDGLETGAPVNATAGHHHGNAYNAVRFRSSPYSYTTVSDMSSGASWFFETPNDAPSGYGKSAVLVSFSCQIAMTGGALSTDGIGLVLEFAGSDNFATYMAGTAGLSMRKSAVDGAVLFFRGQMLVPLYLDLLVNFPTGGVGFRVRIQGFSVGSGVDLSLSTLQIDEVGYVLSRL